MNNAPIGIFDSGIGGVTIFKSIKKLLPKENFLYFSDNLNSPYGNKSKKEIQILSLKNSEWLLNKGCKIIVVACNTATTNCISMLRESFKTPFIGVEPAIKPAATNTRTGNIGVLATKGTLNSNLFEITSNDYCSKINIIEKNGDGLVDMIENGILNGTEIEKLLLKFLSPMIKSNIDHLVLGCTHYPLINDSIEKILPNNVKILESGEAVAKQTKKIIIDNNLAGNNKNPTYNFYCNGRDNSLKKILTNNFKINTI
jgi:glutamate racemase